MADGIDLVAGMRHGDGVHGDLPLGQLPDRIAPVRIGGHAVAHQREGANGPSGISLAPAFRARPTDEPCELQRLELAHIRQRRPGCRRG